MTDVVVIVRTAEGPLAWCPPFGFWARFCVVHERGRVAICETESLILSFVQHARSMAKAKGDAEHSAKWSRCADLRVVLRPEPMKYIPELFSPPTLHARERNLHP